MIKIASDRLTVEILEPGSPIYARTRFDWTGFITQVTLEGKHTFCVPESLTAGQGTGGIGLCNEFSSSIPVGYRDANPGDQFPKIGVGLMTRANDQEYSPFYPYANSPFPMRTEIEPSAATFIVDPVPVRGYATRLVKRVYAEGNTLVVHSRLENIGVNRIVTAEYNHNFVAIDNLPFGPNYTLEFPFDVSLAAEGQEPAPFVVQGGSITWPKKPEDAYCFSVAGFTGTKTPYWELKNSTTGTSVREQTDFDWARCILFGTAHLVSAEVFVAIDIAPGESQEWTRTYSFSTE